MRTEPVNEVIKGEEALWKLPCKEYHGKCRFGHPRVNWLIETSNDAWKLHNLWKKTREEMPTEFNHKKPEHVNIVVKAALDRIF